ncbi:hypothetical protein M3Y99_01033200 [Aphelenchoides fujianensis]|nr:hypothetical protein M3Y99_01033200 [Aphelenchoides fujianensis]
MKPKMRMDLAQKDIRCLKLQFEYCQETFGCLRTMRFLLGAVQNQPHLGAVKVMNLWRDKAAWLVHLLREFLPTSIAGFSSMRDLDYLLFVLPPSSRRADRVEIVV